MRIGGKIEVASRNVIRGWLAVFGHSERRPTLELMLGGKSIGSAIADEHRPDVAAKGLGDGQCQFRIVVPEDITDEEFQRLRLRIAGSELYLELPRARQHQPTMSVNGEELGSPVFIVGSPRSGTSILTRFMHAAGYHGFAEGNLLGLSQMIEQRVDWYFRANRDAPPATLLGNVDEEILKSDLFTVFKSVLDRYNPVHPWFDKTGNPETILILPRVLKAWPLSRVIFAKRRGIENIMSRLSKFSERDFAYHCKDWASNMQAWREIRDTLDPARIMEVDQRDIIDTPDDTAMRLAGLLGLDDEKAARGASVFKTDRPQETFPGSAARVVPISDTGWTAAQIATFEELCGTEMKNYGYS